MIEVAGGANAVGEGIRRTAIGIDAGAENDCDVCRAAVIGFAEEEHLGEGEHCGAAKTDSQDGEELPWIFMRSAAGLRHSRGPCKENHRQCGTHKEGEWNWNSRMN